MSKASEKPARSTRSYRIPRVIRNWVSLAGAILSGSSIFAFVMLFAIDLFAKHEKLVGAGFLIVLVGGFVLVKILAKRVVKKDQEKKAEEEAEEAADAE